MHEENDELKCDLYNLAYMNNLSFTANNKDKFIQVYTKSQHIFKGCKFELQQFKTEIKLTKICG